MNEKPKPEGYPCNFFVCFEDPAIPWREAKTLEEARRIVLNLQPLAKFCHDTGNGQIDFHLAVYGQLRGEKRLGWIQRKYDAYEEALKQWRFENRLEDQGERDEQAG